MNGKKESFRRFLMAWVNCVNNEVLLMLPARGVFVNSNTIKISGGQSIVFDRCVIATGSRPVVPDQFVDSKSVVMDSTEALSLSFIPEKLLVVGGGYIGLEIGTVYSALGSRVTIVEFKDGLLPEVDRDLVRPLQEKLFNEFESVYLGTEVVSIRESGKSRVCHNGVR